MCLSKVEEKLGPGSSGSGLTSLTQGTLPSQGLHLTGDMVHMHLSGMGAFRGLRSASRSGLEGAWLNLDCCIRVRVTLRSWVRVKDRVRVK